MQNNFTPVFYEDEVKVCAGNASINARGENAKLLTLAFSFMLVCIGIALLANR